MKNQLNTLNCMRVLALIGVLGYHLLPEVMMGGYLGVILFFQLSGFLLVYKSSDINTIKDVGRFYSHKLKRIYGPLLIMILSTLGIFSFLDINGLPVSLQELLSIFGGYNNQWQISQDLSYFARALNQSPYTHLWFIAIEIQFYFLWPLFIFIYKRMKEKAGNGATIVVFLLSIASLLPMILLTRVGDDISLVYYSSITRMGAMLWGVMAGFLYQDRSVLKKWKLIIVRLTTYGFIGGLLFLYFTLNSLWVETYTIAIPIFTVITAAGLGVITSLNSAFILSNTDKKFNIFLAKLNKHISTYSYEIYLWMFPVIYVSNKMGVQSNAYTIIGQVLIIVLCSLLSYAVMKFLTRVKFKFIKEFTWKSLTIKNVLLGMLSTLMLTLMFAGTLYATQLPMNTDNTELEELLASMVEMENDQATLEDTDDESEKLVITVPDKIIIFVYYESVQDKIDENAKLKEEYFIEKARLEAEAKAKAEAEAKAKAEAAAKAAAKKKSTSSGSSSISAGNGIGVTSSISVYFYGDSVMLGAGPSLKATYPNSSVDAVVSRNASTVAKSASSIFGSVGNGTIVIALGTNGGVSESNATKIVEGIPNSKRIYFVTVKGVSSAGSTNNNLRAVASKYGHVSVIDWNSYASGSSGWVYSDGYHLRPEGQRAYAQLMYNSLG